MSNISPPSHPPSIPTLPPELLTLVFEQLASKHCFGIKNCRLVSREFYRLSSPFFINTIVIAERLDTLARTKAIIDQPYFSKNVTHIIWDASFFEPELARNAEAYKKEWFDTHGCFTTPDLDESWRSDHRTLRDLLQYNPRKQNTSAVAPSAIPLPGHEVDGDYANGSEDWSDDGDHEHARVVSGFAEYHQKYVNQESIRRRKLAWRYLHIAFEKLPNLRHVSFADYRALSFNGESFTEMRHRLFGQALSPRHLSRRFPRGNSRQVPTGIDFGDFIRHLPHIKPKIQTLSIGRNNFAIPTLDTECDNQTKRLISFNPQQTANSANSYLKATTSAMEHLGVASRAIPPHPRDLRDQEDVDSLGDLFHSDYTEQPSVLSTLFNGLYFEKLRSLELQNWSFTLEEFEAIIFPHAATIESVHLIGCFCHGAYTTSLARISEEWPRRLSILGAEVAGLMFQVDQAEDEHLQTPSHECGIQMTDMPCAIAQPDVYESRHPFVLCPNDRPEIEAAMLGGRENRVLRLAPRADLSSSNSGWQAVAIYHTY